MTEKFEFKTTIEIEVTVKGSVIPGEPRTQWYPGFPTEAEVAEVILQPQRWTKYDTDIISYIDDDTLERLEDLLLQKADIAAIEAEEMRAESLLKSREESEER